MPSLLERAENALIGKIPLLGGVYLGLPCVLRRIVGFLLILVIAALLAEGGLRLFHTPDALSANITEAIEESGQSEITAFDDQDFRAAHWAAHWRESAGGIDPKESINIVLLGDNSLAGFGLAKPDRRALSGELLSQLPGKERFRVCNFALPGLSFATAADLLEEGAIFEYEIDVLVVSLGFEELRSLLAPPERATLATLESLETPSSLLYAACFAPEEGLGQAERSVSEEDIHRLIGEMMGLIRRIQKVGVERNVGVVFVLSPSVLGLSPQALDSLGLSVEQAATVLRNLRDIVNGLDSVSRIRKRPSHFFDLSTQETKSPEQPSFSPLVGPILAPLAYREFGRQLGKALYDATPWRHSARVEGMAAQATSE